MVRHIFFKKRRKFTLVKKALNAIFRRSYKKPNYKKFIIVQRSDDFSRLTMTLPLIILKMTFTNLKFTLVDKAHKVLCCYSSGSLVLQVLVVVKKHHKQFHKLFQKCVILFDPIELERLKFKLIVKFLWQFII